MTQIPSLPGEALLLLFLQMAVLLGVARLLGELAKRLDQPSVLGELLAGILLGPSLLGWIWPGGFDHLYPAAVEQRHLLEMMSWLGMVLLMLHTGLETDVRLIRHLGRPALSSSFFGMVVPFAAGFAFAEVLPGTYLVPGISRHLFASFFATAMAISAMPVIAKILLDLELTKRNIGVVILSAGVVDDTTGWLLLSVITGAVGTSGFSMWRLARTLGLTAAFLAVSALVAHPALRALFRLVDDRAHVRDGALSLIVVLTLLAAATTEWIGIHAVFGAFVAGCVIRQAPRVRRATLERLEAMTMGVFAPIFFGHVGLQVNLRDLGSPWIVLAVIGVATAGKLVGCTAGARLGGMSSWESLALGMGMNARGAMGLVVALLGLSLGILSQPMYASIVVMAMVTSFVAPVALRMTMRRVAMSAEEEARIAAEGQTGLFDRLRLKALVPTAGGRNALAAAHLGAALVRGEGTLATLYVDRAGRGVVERIVQRLWPDRAGLNLQQHLDEIRACAEAHTARLEMRRSTDSDPVQAICKEVTRGMDLLLLGTSERARGRLQGDLLRALVARAPAHLALVRAPLEHGAPPATFHRVLVPCDGSYFSRAAVELAVLYAEGTEAEVTILYALEGAGVDDQGGGDLDEGFRRLMGTTLRTTLSPVLATTKAKVTVVVREAGELTLPVLRELEAGLYDLLVVGAEARAVLQRLSVGYDVERLVDLARCTTVVAVPRVGSAAEGAG